MILSADGQKQTIDESWFEKNQKEMTRLTKDLNNEMLAMISNHRKRTMNSFGDIPEAEMFFYMILVDALVGASHSTIIANSYAKKLFQQLYKQRLMEL